MRYPAQRQDSAGTGPSYKAMVAPGDYPARIRAVRRQKWDDDDPDDWTYELEVLASHCGQPRDVLADLKIDPRDPQWGWRATQIAECLGFDVEAGIDPEEAEGGRVTVTLTAGRSRMFIDRIHRLRPEHAKAWTYGAEDDSGDAGEDPFF